MIKYSLYFDSVNYQIPYLLIDDLIGPNLHGLKDRILRYMHFYKVIKVTSHFR